MTPIADYYTKKLAELLVNYSVSVGAGEKVVIEGTSSASDLLLEIYKEVLKAGGLPHISPTLPEQDYAYYANASEKQLDAEDPIEAFMVENADIFIALFNRDNVKELSNISPDAIARRRRAKKRITEMFNKRESEGLLRWVGSIFPSNNLAQEASMSLEEYREFVYHACLLNYDDPVSKWKCISKEQEKLCNWLNNKETLHFVGKDTDLTMSCKKRKWINCDGKLNMPDGEVFTGPVEDSANGTIRFSYPAIYMGNEVENIQLTFKDGVISDFSASKGEKFLKAMINTDEGSNHIGEIAIGTNYGIAKFTKEILFDEKMGGTMHLAIGDSFPATNATNRSTIHWDMLKDMKSGGKVYADGEVFYENGKFII
ncbi:MAG: aminopeptidase [Candidatus Methanofastidiosia archaeon]